MTDRADTIAAKIEAFIRADVIPYERDPRTGPHGPSDELVQFLGHVAGFLEGPANKANDAERQKFEAQLLECGRTRPLCVGATRRARRKRRHVAAAQNVQTPA